MKKDNLKRVLIFLFVIAWYSIVFLGEETANYLRDEDNLIENLGAMWFLIASILYFVCYLKFQKLDGDKNHIQSKRKYFYLFFAILFFVGFGEEISWGQTIFDWEGPQFFMEINKQKETNLHNLWVFRIGFLRPDIWFFIFWFSYCVILPLATRYSLGSKRYLSGLGLPVPPLWIGFLLLTNFLIYLIPQFFSSDWPKTFYIDRAFLEIMESNCAFIFAVLSFHELKKQLSKKKEGC